MGEQELVVRLTGTGVPDGELSFAAISRLAEAMQELAVRIGRWSADQAGPGRSFAAVESAARLRLTGVTEGSTELHVKQGAHDVLPIDDGLEGQIQARFAQALAGIPRGEVPAWAPVAVKQTVVRVIDAFDYAAAEVELTLPGRALVRFAPAVVSRGPWATPDDVSDDRVEMVGRLEAVDLDTRRFRLRDDVGNRIPLHHVRDSDVAGTLIGQRVVARGRARSDPHGVVGVEGARVDALSLPESWTRREGVDYNEIVASVPGPSPDGGAELTDEEFAAFLAATDQ